MTVMKYHGMMAKKGYLKSDGPLQCQIWMGGAHNPINRGSKHKAQHLQLLPHVPIAWEPFCIFKASIRAELTVSGSKVSCPITCTCPFRSFHGSSCHVPSPIFLPKSRKASSNWEAWDLCSIVPAHPRDSSCQCTRPRFEKWGRKWALWQDQVEGRGFLLGRRNSLAACCSSICFCLWIFRFWACLWWTRYVIYLNLPIWTQIMLPGSAVSIGVLWIWFQRKGSQYKLINPVLKPVSQSLI